ncbi:hypothetical protein [Alkalihalobacillus pseudalcaliphilus]|uniref:hypothetical protein n=1 Tax=Alkalihalobacillus pseudalcaliphilus TaxID=79884 RepID=UPI00064DA669|nr:hypothetical protein [Alkalihalobacillus pseudalcaliphilus]KMK78048.1 hypothetical protein AB990_00925 [Alkalihalobacillus pseudalcaliphilus]
MKFFRILLLVLLFSLTSTTLTFANELTLSDVVILTENQVSELSQEQRKHKLIERGFTEEDVKNMSNHTQITFLEANGIKASYEVGETNHLYHTINGETHNFNALTEHEIQKIKQEEHQLFLKEGQLVAPFNSEYREHGSWTGYIHAMVLEEDANNYIYLVSVDWHYNSGVFAMHTDAFGLTWDQNFTGYGDLLTYSAMAISYDGDFYDRTNISIDVNRMGGGTGGTISVGNYAQQGGSFVQQISAPKRLSGENAELIFDYVHPHLPGFISVSIDAGVFEFDFTGIFSGDEWYIPLSLQIGS